MRYFDVNAARRYEKRIFSLDINRGEAKENARICIIYGNKRYYGRKKQREGDHNLIENLQTTTLHNTQRLKCDERYNDENGEQVESLFADFRPCHAIGRTDFYPDDVLEDGELDFDRHGYDTERAWVEIDDISPEYLYGSDDPHWDINEDDNPKWDIYMDDETEDRDFDWDENWGTEYDDGFPGEHRSNRKGRFWHFYGMEGNGNGYRYGFHGFVVHEDIMYHVGLRSNWHMLMDNKGNYVNKMPVWATKNGSRSHIRNLEIPDKAKEMLREIINEACEKAEENPTELSLFDSMNLLTIPDITQKT